MNAQANQPTSHYVTALSGAVSGERFWEQDIGLLYNEYVKVRYFDLSRNLSSMIPAGPAFDADPFAPIPLTKSYDGERVELPAFEPTTLPVGEALLSRRSRREYVMEGLPGKTLGALLGYAAGVTDTVAGYGYEQITLRTFPSSGGLQAAEVYAIVNRVDDVAPGLYHYHPADNALEAMQLADLGPVLMAMGIGQTYLQTAAVVFVLTGVYPRLAWKYGERAFRYMCMDVGFVAQNLYLVAEGLGLGACAVAGFVDDALESLLGIDGRDEIPLLMVAVGRLAD